MYINNYNTEVDLCMRFLMEINVILTFQLLIFHYLTHLAQKYYHLGGGFSVIIDNVTNNESLYYAIQLNVFIN